jgi:flavin-dependent dehydrogenase
MENNSKNKYDVLVIGGGPAGATAATILAQYGRKIAILEKDWFPRYHIGESLIPYTYFPLQRIGMINKLHKYNFVKKYSVQFAGSNGKTPHPFYFTDHMKNEAAQTWQVERNQFDQMLLDNAKEKGVTVVQGVKVDKILKKDEKITGVYAYNEDREGIEYFAPLIIDASGRNGLILKRYGWAVPDPLLKKVSIWNYFKDAKRDSGVDEGATTVAYLPDKGWFWYIPLQNNIVSVGVVADKNYLYKNSRNPEMIFQHEIENNKWIKDHLAGSQAIDQYRVTADFSYRSKYCASDGIVLTGDAFAFLDPVFSSGLYFALKGGELVADAVEQALKKGDVSAAQFTDYGDTFCRYIELMRRFVYIFYDKDFSFRPLFKKYPDVAADVTDCLIGNLDKDFSGMFQAMQEFAQIPKPLEHGKPFINTNQSVSA